MMELIGGLIAALLAALAALMHSKKKQGQAEAHEKLERQKRDAMAAITKRVASANANDRDKLRAKYSRPPRDNDAK